MAGYLLVCLVVVATTGFTQVIEKPFTEVPDNPTYVPIGSDARLKWSFPVGDDFKEVVIEYKDVGPFSTLMIKKKGQTAIVNPNIQLPKNLTERVTIEGYATFVISNIYPEDTKYRYRCKYVPTAGGSTAAKDVQIVLSEQPGNVTCLPKIKKINPNETAVFNCTADGFPTPEFDWYNRLGERMEEKAGVEINNSSGLSILTIWEANSTSSGYYTCRVKNIAGGKNVSGYLNVEFCEIRGKQSQISTYCVKVGDEVSLPCPLYGNPQPEIVWDYPDKADEANKTLRTQNDLLVRVTRDEDFGEYRCFGCGEEFVFELKTLKDCGCPSSTVPQAAAKKTNVAAIVLGILFAISVLINSYQCYKAWKGSN